jgi:ABC-type transport system substrate-binding protein
VTELYQRSITTFDPEERTAVLQELSAAIVEDALDVVVLYFPDKVVAWNDRVQNIDLWASGRPELRGVSMTRG